MQCLRCHAMLTLSCNAYAVMQSLVYSRVAAVVRACQFKIDDTLQPEEIPFCGGPTANKIKDIARTGTTSVLEAHRCHLLPGCSHSSSALLLQESDKCVCVCVCLCLCLCVCRQHHVSDLLLRCTRWAARPVMCTHLNSNGRNLRLSWHSSRREISSSRAAFDALHLVRSN